MGASLEPYDYAEVKAAAAAYAPRKRFFPDIQDLTEKLMPRVTQIEENSGMSELERLDKMLKQIQAGG